MTAVPFGARGSTGKKGLGTESSGHAGCLDIRFGAVHAHVDSGCFLRVATKKDPKGDASIAYGGVHVNGLEVRPDSPGTAIVIDDAAHTIDSVGGSVSVLLQHPGIPDVQLWDGPLHADLGKADNVGDPLFALPMTSFHANVLGFEALGTPTAVLGTESVSIPLSLKLPSYLGVTGSATLAANMTEGLVRPSLHIAIPDVVMSGLELRGASIDWAGPEQQWTGAGELEMQPGAGASGLDVKGAQIAFDHGDFSSGGFTTAPYPGTPILRNAYLAELGAAFNLHPPPSLTGNAELGAVAHGGGVYSAEATGPLQTTFGNPSTMSVEGTGAIYGVPLTNAHATFTTAGTFHETGTLGFDSFGLENRRHRRRHHGPRRRHHQRHHRRHLLLRRPRRRRDPPLQRHRLRLLQGIRRLPRELLGGLPLQVGRRRRSLPHRLRIRDRRLRRRRHSRLGVPHQRSNLVN